MESVNSKKHVLVVDDEPGVGKVLSIKLKLSGFEVTTTTSGAEAIELVRGGAPDIMLLDILMPVVTGFDVLEKVRAFSKIPIIVFTARPDVFRMAMDMGATDFVAKPFNPDQLVEKIRQVLSNGHNRPAAGGQATG